MDKSVTDTEVNGFTEDAVEVPDNSAKQSAESENVDQAEQQIPSLDLQDLVKVLNVLNVAIKRGVYEPSELTQVGEAYGKLEKFLQYQAQLQAAARKAQEDKGES